MANNDSGGSFVAGFLMGGIVGAVVGILLAPRAGTETRADLAERSDLWRSRAEEMAATLRERVGPAVESARERVGPAVEGVRERVAPVVEQVSSRMGRTRDIGEVLEDGASFAEDGADEQSNGEKT